MANGTSTKEVINKIPEMIAETMVYLALQKRQIDEWNRCILKMELGPNKYLTYVASKNKKSSD